MDGKIDRLQEGQLSLHREFSAIQSHTDTRFLDVAGQFQNLHKEISEIHRSIAIQTCWILSVILFASVLAPLILKILDLYVP